MIYKIAKLWKQFKKNYKKKPDVYNFSSKK